MTRSFLAWPVLLLTLLWAAMGLAQDRPEIDYDAWSRTALRAEQAVEAGRASDAAMLALRAELVQWRKKFDQAQSVNAQTIASVKAQLDALGPKPEDGDEPAEIAAQRQELNQRLAALQAPAKSAQVAFSQANALIASIDEIMRARQAEALLARGPTPLNPVIWPSGLKALATAFSGTRSEIVSAWNNPTQREALRANMPAVLVLASVGLVLLVLGRRWMLVLTQRIMERPVTPARWLGAFSLSLGQAIVPLIGLYLIVEAAYRSELVGLRTDPLLQQVQNAGLYIFFALWLGARIFPRDTAHQRAMHLSPEQLAEGRIVSGLLGATIALHGFIAEFARYDSWSDEAQAVVYAPLIALGGVLIWRLGRLLRIHTAAALAEATADDAPLRYSERLYGLLGQALKVLAFAGPTLAAAGYLRAAQTAIFPLIESLFLIAAVLITQRVLAELYVVLRGREDAREGLVPVLVGMVLIILSAPVLALIWGMSPNQLEDIWNGILAGFTIGNTTISPVAFLTFAVVFSIGLVITRLLQGAVRNTILPKTKMDVGARNALVSGLGYVGIVLAALIAITTAGIDLSSLAIVAGALSVGIGFGLQNIVSNFVSGIILLIERPITEGDWIEVSGTQGTVRAISVRSTRIETFDRSDVILPNTDLISGKVTNYTRGNTLGRITVPVGVAYGTDTAKVMSVLKGIGESHPLVLAHPAPYVVFQGFGADSMDFEIRAILRDVNWILTVRTEMNNEIVRRFAEENIEIPFAQRDIWLRNPEVLPGAPQRRDADDAAPASAPPARELHEIDDLASDGTDEGAGDGDKR